MKSVLLSLAMLIGGAAHAVPSFEASDGRQCAQGQILVVGENQGKHLGAGVHLVDVPKGSEEKEIKNHKNAELNCKVDLAFIPNDPYYASYQWHLPKIGAPAAWDITQGSGIVVAVLDTGVASTQPDLQGQLVPGWNFVTNVANTEDFMGHGTPVAGTIVALTNNGIGMASVAGLAKVMPLIVTDSTGSTYYSYLSQAVTYAADHGARVASMSFSGVAFSTAVQSACTYMQSKGGLCVVAAGNTSAIDNVAPTSTMIVVASTEADDSHTPSSTFGPFVTVSAPGSNIGSTDWGGSYGVYGGTSFSTPIVAATLALMMSINPALPATQYQSILQSTAVDLGTAGWDQYFGYGRINALAAVQAARDALPPPVDTTPPVVALTSPSGTVSGTVTIAATASDNVGVTKVEISVNGALKATDTTSPYAYSWNTTTVANGSVTLSAKAYDAAGNTSTSTSVVTVSNTVVCHGNKCPHSPTKK